MPIAMPVPYLANEAAFVHAHGCVETREALKETFLQTVWRCVRRLFTQDCSAPELAAQGVVPMCAHADRCMERQAQAVRINTLRTTAAQMRAELLRSLYGILTRELAVPEAELLCLCADEYVERRAQALRSAIRKHSGAKLAELPVALIENSSRAPTNDSGEKLLGNKRAWLPDLMTEVAAHSPWQHMEPALSILTSSSLGWQIGSLAWPGCG